ncbi:hypothetical protein LINGRAHAP2_LOCUS9696 [Linum grandiflorum]
MLQPPPLLAVFQQLIKRSCSRHISKMPSFCEGLTTITRIGWLRMMVFISARPGRTLMFSGNHGLK